MPVISEEGTAKVKIISPGVGSSGYYSPEVLERDAAKFAGAQCYWDHPSLSEDRDRPERSLRDLAGKVQGIPAWDGNGPTGPGIYADVQVFKPYQESVEELAPHIGMSIRATGTAKPGKINGKKMPVIEGIDKVRSVDFVTLPGRGGEIIKMFEAARGTTEDIALDEINLEDLKRHRGDLIEALRDEMKQAIYDEKKALKEAERMTQERIAELEEANRKLEEEKGEQVSELARLREAEILRQARDIVTEKVGAAKLPDITRERLSTSLSKSPVLKEGELDTEEFSHHIDEAIKAEVDYVAKLTGAGNPRGMGEGGPAPDQGKTQLRESHKQAYLREGKSPEMAERLADLAAQGR